MTKEIIVLLVMLLLLFVCFLGFITLMDPGF